MAATPKLDSEQLANADTIRSIGVAMGRSTRDITVAIATALQESSLRNLKGGDRDSAGLFQQRPSQGWGTLAQVTDPEYATRKFYTELSKIKGRDKMSVTQAAQKVQRSAYPDAYAKWEGLASQLALGKNLDAPIVKTTGTASRPSSLNDAYSPGSVVGGVVDKVIGDPVGDVVESVTAPFTDPNLWLRVAFIGGGLILVLIGVAAMLAGSSTVREAAAAAAK